MSSSVCQEVANRSRTLHLHLTVGLPIKEFDLVNWYCNINSNKIVRCLQGLLDILIWPKIMGFFFYNVRLIQPGGDDHQYR